MAEGKCVFRWSLAIALPFVIQFFGIYLSKSLLRPEGYALELAGLVVGPVVGFLMLPARAKPDPFLVGVAYFTIMIGVLFYASLMFVGYVYGLYL